MIQKPHHPFSSNPSFHSDSILQNVFPLHNPSDFCIHFWLQQRTKFRCSSQQLSVAGVRFRRASESQRGWPQQLLDSRSSLQRAPESWPQSTVISHVQSIPTVFVYHLLNVKLMYVISSLFKV